MGERKRSLASLCQIFCFVFQSHASSQFKSSEVDIILVYGSQIWCVVQKNSLAHRIYLTKKKLKQTEKISFNYLIRGDITILNLPTEGEKNLLLLCQNLKYITPPDLYG